MFECYLSMYGTVPWYHRFFSKQRTPFCSHDVNFMNQHIPKQLPHIEIMIICIPTGGEPFFANFVVRGCQESAGRRIVFTTFWIPSMQQRRLEEDQEAFLRCPQLGQGPKYPQNLWRCLAMGCSSSKLDHLQDSLHVMLSNDTRTKAGTAKRHDPLSHSHSTTTMTEECEDGTLARSRHCGAVSIKHLCQ